MEFMGENFLLQSETAQRLFHEYARKMPIFDYHCHLPPAQIAENHQFQNMTAIWLAGDHYKWRAMRANGVAERFVTGDASDFDKFKAWAQTVPATIRNPLYHWTHMELRTFFGIEDLLNEDTAKSIYNRCNEALKQDEFRVRGLLARSNVKVVCTTDDPVDRLEFHEEIKKDASFPTKVLPGFRPDKAMGVENPQAFNAWVGALQEVTGDEIKDFSTFIEALKKRHEFFHHMGCRLSDHGIEEPYAEEYLDSEIVYIFHKVRSGKSLDLLEIRKFKSAMLYEFALMNAEKGWTFQLHLGAIRSVNSRGFKRVGPDTGYDSMGDFTVGWPLARFLDRLDSQERLPKTILYTVNPRDNAILASMTGNFQDGKTPGKIQFGAAWWYNDTKRGMEEQMNILSEMGLLARFLGMITDSRSFLSYPRHDYFRRILCNLIGQDVENGELPSDLPMLGRIVQDISYNNAVKYFGFSLR